METNGNSPLSACSSIIAVLTAHICGPILNHPASAYYAHPNKREGPISRELLRETARKLCTLMYPNNDYSNQPDGRPQHETQAAITPREVA